MTACPDRVIPMPQVAAMAAPEPESALTPEARQAAYLGARAQAIGWCSILAGALSGMLMGLWSFDGPFPVPGWIGGYDELPRRFLRLAHIAMFALGMLHVMVGKWLATSGMPHRFKRSGYATMALGNFLMPATLIGAAIWAPLKYATAVPTLALTIAFAIVAQDAVRAMRRV